MPLISDLSGRAGSTYAPLPPGSGPRQEFAHGPFTADLAPSLPVRGSGVFPDQLFIGLLTKMPDADGVGGVELSHPGYQRQPVDLQPRDNVYLSVGRPVLFDLSACPALESLAIFDSEGRVVAYGALRGVSSSTTPPARFEFSGHQILVRKA